MSRLISPRPIYLDDFRGLWYKYLQGASAYVQMVTDLMDCTQHQMTAQQSLRILIVEDERDVLDMLQEVLSGEGHAVITAPDGEAALACFQEQPCDIVFTDLNMPGMSGWEVADRIKDLNSSVPVVLLTGWDVELEKLELKIKGIDYFIKKPFSIAAILEALGDLCGTGKNAE